MPLILNHVVWNFLSDADNEYGDDYDDDNQNNKYSQDNHNEDILTKSTKNLQSQQGQIPVSLNFIPGRLSL